jgi:hypothetical protein
MKRKEFSEEQIIGILKEAEAGAVGDGSVPTARDVERDLLHVEGEVRGAGGVRCEAAAGAVVGADRKSMRYRSCRGDDGDLRSRLRELAQQRRRFGYRRLPILLRRDGVTINRKKTQRLYRQEGLTVRRRKGRKRAVGARAPAPVLALPNQRWSLDFVDDQLAMG